MASLKCSNCGNGIHYHGEPCDIGYYWIKKSEWLEFLKNKFDAKNKIYNSLNRPKLFRSSTIVDDFDGEIVEGWKCDQCGTFHIFDSEFKVRGVFTEDAKQQVLEGEIFSPDEVYVVYNDHEWYEMTEADISLSKVESSYNPKYFWKKKNGRYYLSSKGEFDKDSKTYIQIEVSNEK